MRELFRRSFGAPRVQREGEDMDGGGRMDRLRGKVAVITGASSGFGRGIVRAFAAQGAKVVVSDVREELTEGGIRSATQVPGYAVSPAPRPAKT